MPIVSPKWRNKIRVLLGTWPRFSTKNDSLLVQKRRGLEKFIPLGGIIGSTNEGRAGIAFKRINVDVLLGKPVDGRRSPLESFVVDKAYNILVERHGWVFPPIGALRRLGTSKVQVKIVVLYDEWKNNLHYYQLVIYKFPDGKEPLAHAENLITRAQEEEFKKARTESAQVEAALAKAERF